MAFVLFPRSFAWISLFFKILKFKLLRLSKGFRNRNSFSTNATPSAVETLSTRSFTKASSACLVTTRKRCTCLPTEWRPLDQISGSECCEWHLRGAFSHRCELIEFKAFDDAKWSKFWVRSSNEKQDVSEILKFKFRSSSSFQSTSQMQTLRAHSVWMIRKSFWNGPVFVQGRSSCSRKKPGE